MESVYEGTGGAGLNTILAILTILAAFAAGYFIRGCRTVPTIPDAPVIHLDLHEPPLHVPPAEPIQRIIYRQRTDTVRIEIPVPIDYALWGTITSAPVSIRGRDVTLTYWHPDELRYEQAVYRVEPPRFRAWIDAGTEYTDGFAFDARGNVSFRTVSAFAGYRLGEWTGVIVGMRVELWGTPK